jgi:predicted Zn-dependent protease
MLDRTEIEKIADLILEASPAEQTEVMVSAGESALTRYANNLIHQNVWEDNASVSIRAVRGQRVGVTSTNDTRPEALRAAAEQAAHVASLAPENPDFPGLPAAPAAEPGPAPAAATIASTPETRGAAVAQVLEIAKADDLVASGALEVGYSALLVANSHGTRAYQELTRASLSAMMTVGSSSGRAEVHSADAAAIDPVAAGRVAADKALTGRDPRAIEPGAYTVILEPLAVTDLLFWLGIYGFNALAYQEKRSFLCEKLGQRIVDKRLNLTDDGRDPRGLPLVFDFEGVPKQRVPLIENGVAVAMVHDTRTAAKAGPPAVSTGHALPAPNPWGPVPTNMFLETGPSSSEELLASTERGLLVTRFHYTNIVHPLQTVLTGMTRDGTFLVEGGQIVAGVRNLRFTESILEALDRVQRIGDTGAQCEYAWSPALQIEDFNFTGTTEP